MDSWKDIKIEDIASIKKCVAEFDIGELKKTPWAKFKIKIYERQDSSFYGYTNLQIKDEDGCPFGGVGYGETIEEALKSTIENFLEMLNEKDIWNEKDFEVIDSYDF